uniref:oleoyl-[acyl-carrier-protein] hydrolase n=1 Tax=Ditylenchus dipsaci TaxID=166011 RepID=A0A915DZ70_9BILA
MFNRQNLDLTLKDLLNPNTSLKQFIYKLEANIAYNLTKTVPSINTDCMTFRNIPLSYQQEQMYYLSHVDAPNTYYLPLIQQFTLDLDVAALHIAFLQTLQHNPTLRTRITESSDYDLFQEHLSLTETYFAYPANIYVQSNQQILTEIKQFSDQKLDLRKEPPLRCRLFKTKTVHILVVLVHHIAIDATSTQIIEQEIAHRYNHLKNSHKSKIPFPTKSMTYAQWSVRQKNEENQIIMHEKSVELADRIVHKLPHRLDVKQLFSYSTYPDVEKLNFEVSICAIRSCGITAYSFFSIALAHAFELWKNNNEKCVLFVGSPASNRACEDISQTIGNFLTNIIVMLPLDITTQLPFAALAKLVQQEIDKANQYSDLPYPIVHEAICKKSCEKHENLFEVFLNCRYGLEDEQSLKQMEDAVLDLEFAEELLDSIRINKANQFLEINVDQMSSKKCFQVQMRSNDKTVELSKFFELFKIKCLGIAKVGRMQIAEGVRLAVCQTLSPNIKLEHIKDEDNFFALGGNSFSLLKLRRKLNERFEVEVDIQQLISNPGMQAIEKHVEDLVLHNFQVSSHESLDRDENSSEAVLNPSSVSKIVVQNIFVPDSRNTPEVILVLFHPLIGGNICYRHLSRQLQKQAKRLFWIIGIQHPATFSDTPLPNIDSLHQLTQFYADRITDHFKSLIHDIAEAKLVFVGASLGSVLAYECAQKMKDDLCVDLIVSIDGSAGPTTSISKAEHIKQMLQVINGHTTIVHDSTVIEAMLENSWVLLEMRVSHKFTMELKKNMEIVMLKVKDSKEVVDDYGWSNLGHKVTITEIDGDHATMLNEIHSKNLAVIVWKYIL